MNERDVPVSREEAHELWEALVTVGELFAVVGDALEELSERVTLIELDLGLTGGQQ